MAHPYKEAAHRNDPKWIKGLETPKVHREFERADLKATLIPRTGNAKITAQAAYVDNKKGK